MARSTMIHNRPVQISLFQRIVDIIPVASMISSVVHLIRYILSKHSSSVIPRPLQDRDVRHLTHKQWGLEKRALLAAIPLIGNAILLAYEMNQCSKKRVPQAPEAAIQQPLHEQIEQLKNELEQQNAALIRKQEISEVAHKTIQDLQQRVANSDLEKLTLIQNVQILNENTQEFKDQLQALEQEKEDLTHRNEELSDKNQALSRTEEEIQNIQKELETQKEYIDLIEKKNEKLEKDGQEDFFEKMNLRNQVDKSTKREKILRQKLEQATLNTQDQILKLKENLSSAEQEKEKLLREIDELKTQNNLKKKDSEDLLKTNEDLRSHIHQSSLETINLQKQLKITSQLNQDEIRKLQALLDSCLKEKETLIQEIREKEKQKGIQEKIAQTFTHRIKLHEASILEFKEENQNLKATVDNLSLQLQEFNELKQKMDELKKIQSELESLTHEFCSTKIEILKLNKENNLLEHEASEQKNYYNQVIDKLQNELEKLQNFSKNLQASFTEKEEQNTQLKRLNEELNEEIEFLQEEIQAAKAVLSTSKDDVEALVNSFSAGVIDDPSASTLAASFVDVGASYKKFIDRYTKANIETYLLHVLSAGSHAANNIHTAFEKQFGRKTPATKYLGDLLNDFQTKFVNEKSEDLRRKLGLDELTLQEKINTESEIIKTANTLAAAYEKEIKDDIKNLCDKMLNFESITEEQKEFFLKLDTPSKLYSQAFFENIVHTNQWWTKPYTKDIAFDNGLGEAQVEMKALGQPYSSAAPRNRQDLNNPAVPNFFKTSYIPYGNKNETPNVKNEMAAIKADNLTRSAIPVEFDQKDDKLRQEINHILVKKILEENAKLYLEKNPEMAKKKKIQLDFSAVTLLSPSAIIDWAHTFNKVAAADNEALLFKESQEAYEFWDQKPLMIKFNGADVEVEFDIIYMNIPCNDVFYKSVKYISSSYYKERIANRKAIDKLEKKLKTFKSHLEQDTQIFAPELTEDLLQRNKKYQVMEKLMLNIKEMMAIPEHEKLTRFGNNYYALVSRVLMLNSLLCDRVHFGCRSGKDRTGMCNLELDRLLQHTHILGYVPSIEDDIEDKNRDDIGTELTHKLFKESGNLDVIPEANLGCALGMNIGACANPGNKEAKRYALAAAKVFRRPGAAH